MAKHVMKHKQSLIPLDHPAEKMPDWSQLPEELLHLISTSIENCFDVVHARSVCSPWRSSFPFPSCLLERSQSYSLPMISTVKATDSYTLVKVPLFLFRVLTPLRTDASHFEYFLGRICQDDHKLIPSPVQCSVKPDQTMNMLGCQIIPLGHQYRMLNRDCDEWIQDYRDVSYLPLDKEGGEEFVVFYNFNCRLYVFTSAERRLVLFKNIRRQAPCMGLVSFRGKFYAVFITGEKYVIDPYSLEATLISTPSCKFNPPNYLVACGNDELFCVLKKYDHATRVSSFRVSRLNEETGQWVVVNDLGDRVLFISGPFGNISCSAKELPARCGVSGNSILFIHEDCSEPFFYKYGVQTGNVEDEDLSYLRSSNENRVTILNKSFSVLALQVQC